MKTSSGHRACRHTDARFVVCDSCWVREVWPKLAAANVDQAVYTRRVEAAMA